MEEGLASGFFQRDDLSFEALLSPRFNDIGGSDAETLADLDRAEITADGGLGVTYGFGFGTELSLSAVTELTSEHGGTEVNFAVAQPLPLGNVPVFVGAGAVWQEADLAGFLDSVSAAEATTGRAAYAPGDVVVPYLSISTAVPTTDSVSAFAAVTADFLPK